MSRLTRKSSKRALVKHVRGLESRIARLERFAVEEMLRKTTRDGLIRLTLPSSDAEHLDDCAKVKAMRLNAPDIADVCECTCGSLGDQEKRG